MVKNIIFDIGEVLVDIDYTKLIKKTHLSVFELKRLLDVFEKNEDWRDCDRGIYKSYTEIASRLAESNPKLANTINKIFSEDWLEIIDSKNDMIEFLKKMKSNGFKIYLLSNISEEVLEYLKEKFDFFDSIDGAVYSYEVHEIKPNKEIYEILLEKYHLHPNECIFIDDKIENVLTAQRLGINGVHNKNNKTISKLDKMLDDK